MSMMHLSFFHDHTMMVIISIVVFLFCFMIDSGLNNILNMGLMDNQIIEMIWTIMPMVLLIFIAIPSLRLLYLMEETFEASFTLKVIGHQWYWAYDYEDLELKHACYSRYDMGKLKYLYKHGFNSIYRLLDADNFILIPVGFDIRVLVSSGDVIHSWTVPSLGIKADAIPGRMNQLNFYPYLEGLYFGECSEICGVFHSFMPIKVFVTNYDIFEDWWQNCCACSTYEFL
nr:cytochrome c oxidase subunit 2 [Amblyseius tsugawai]